MQRIPLTNDADQIFTTTLGGQVVRVRATWQDQGESWFLSVLDGAGNYLFANTRLRSGVPVVNFRLIDFEGAPFEGDFIPVPLDVTTLEPGRNAWGATHELFYLTADEAAQVLEAFAAETA